MVLHAAADGGGGSAAACGGLGATQDLMLSGILAGLSALRQCYDSAGPSIPDLSRQPGPEPKKSK